MKIRKLSLFLNEYLEINRFNDYCPNGIQVEANDEITKIALGVSASLRLFKQAKEFNADGIIVHHGLFWGNKSESLKDVLAKRVKFLFNNNISLFGIHLPLDYHPEIGNNACIAEVLKLKKRRTFAKHGGMEIGITGELLTPVLLEKIKEKLFSHFGQINTIYDYGEKNIKTVAIVSGGAANDLYEAYEKGADLFITGEVSEPAQEWCREAKMNYIALGHYSSEKYGVQELGKMIFKKFSIQCKFFDIENPV